MGGGGGVSRADIQPPRPRCSAAVVDQQTVKEKKSAFAARLLVREELRLVGHHLHQLMETHV